MITRSFKSSPSVRIPFAITLFTLLALPAHAQNKVEREAREQEVAEETSTMAYHLLEQLNIREQEAYTAYESALDADDIEKIKADLQAIVNGYDKLIAIAPDYAPAFVSFGQMLKRIGERDAANAMFVRADKIDPGLPLVKNQIGNYMAEEGKFLEALGYYLLAEKLDPSEPLYPYQMGSLLQSYKKLFIIEKMYQPKTIDIKIQEHFKRASELDPDNTQYKLRYAQSFFDVGQPNWMRALDLWHELADKAGGDLEKQFVLLSTARVRFHLGHITAAKKLLNSLDHPEIQQARQDLADAIALEQGQAPVIP